MTRPGRVGLLASADVLVAGAGPAGTAAATVLARDGGRELATLLLSPEFSLTSMPQARALVTARGGLRAARRLARDSGSGGTRSP